MSRKTTYRFFVMHRLPQIQILDEQLIAEDERLRAEVYYTESLVCFMTISAFEHIIVVIHSKMKYRIYHSLYLLKGSF